MLDTVAYMPIRLNSKRIPQKSIMGIKGRPMFCWSLETLDKLGIPVHVYCSEPNKIKSLLDFKTKNVVFTKRPKILDGDSVKGIDIYKQFSKDVPAAKYLLVHCTSPFVELESYSRLISALDIYDSACTVIKYQTFTWYDGKPLNFKLPRGKTQDLKPIHIETSGGYAYRDFVLCNNARSSNNNLNIEVTNKEAIDIDNLEDLEILK